MDKEQSSGATAASEEHLQKSRSDLILNMMNTEDDEAGNPPEEISEATVEDVVVPSEAELPKQEAEESEESEDSKESEEKPEAEAKAGQWPDSAKARVAEETAKRKDRTVERDKAIARAAKAEDRVVELEQQLQGAQRPQPTPQNPYSDVYDESSLKKVEREAEKIIEFCETHREGAYDITVGKNEDGTPKKEDFTPEQLTRMKITAERSLRRDIPERRQYLVMRAQADAAAIEAYPDYKDENSELTQVAREILRTIPELERAPDILAWIGHALRGRAAFLAEHGNKPSKNGNESVSTILKSRETKLAPSRLKQRGDMKESENVNVGPAIKKMQDTGSDEDMENAIGAIRSANASRKG